jgi:hypothetical protein
MPVLTVLVIVALDSSIYMDAKRYADRGVPVVFRAAIFVVDTRATWFVGCVVLWIIVFSHTGSAAREHIRDAH